MSLPEPLDPLEMCDLLLVVGAFKSGTSLAVELMQRHGYQDPSRLTNPCERGFGTTRARYVTRECLVVRRINDQLLVGRLQPPMTSTSLRADARERHAISEYLHRFSGPAVIKDPRMMWVLADWIVTARREGRRPGVLLTHRPVKALRAAWAQAPFTRRLERVEFYRAMWTALPLLRRCCEELRVPSVCASLDDLRRWST